MGGGGGQLNMISAARINFLISSDSLMFGSCSSIVK